MFSRVASLLSVATLVAVAVAAPNGDTTQCNTGGNYCCNTNQSNYISQLSQFTGVLGGVLAGVGANAGVTCSPITVIGAAGGSSCTEQPVCCTNNNFNGVVNVGCSPINASA